MQQPTKLILVEGLPGSGKSTTARHIADFLLFNGVEHKLYNEGDFEESVGFFTPGTPTYVHDLQNCWQTFTDANVDNSAIGIFEAHYWQNTAFYMYAMGFASTEIIAIIQTLTDAIAPLNPMLIYFVHDEVDQLNQTMHEMRGEQWSRRIIERDFGLPYHLDRNHTEFRDITQRLEESQEIANQLFDLFPYLKLKIRNPHMDWPGAYVKIHTLLRNHQVIP